MYDFYGFELDEIDQQINRKQGLYTKFHSNGTLKKSVNYSNGLKYGLKQVFDENG